jgi:hypothetical protein
VEARSADDPRLLAVASVLASWDAVFRDGDHALSLVDEAAASAADVGDVATWEFSRGYRAFLLALGHRFDEAIECADDVVRRHTAESLPLSYATYVGFAAQASFLVLADAARARELLRRLRAAGDVTMWALDALEAAVAASIGEVAAAASAVQTIRRRLERAGQEPLPDLLVPAAALAHHLGDDERADVLLRAVRGSDRPTQSFQVTIVYRRLREAVAITDGPSAPLDQIGADTFAWLDELRDGGR